jgi:hypothetical protein
VNRKLCVNLGAEGLGESFRLALGGSSSLLDRTGDNLATRLKLSSSDSLSLSHRVSGSFFSLYN